MGIAESGISGKSKSTLCGVIMRGDLVIDGITWGQAAIRGLNATQVILEMYEELNRSDVDGILLHGTIIAGYNVIDMNLLFEETSLPIISVTKQPQEDMKKHLKSTFPGDWKKRWKVAQKNGDVDSIRMLDSTEMFVQCKGCELEDTKEILRRFSRSTGLPEPVRVARLLARAFVEKTS